MGCGVVTAENETSIQPREDKVKDTAPTKNIH